MSDRAVQSVTDTNGTKRQTVQSSYQSTWMTHWMSRSFDTARKTRSHDVTKNEELDYATKDDNLTNGLDVYSSSVKRLGVIETKTFEIVDEIVKTSSERRGKAVVDYKSGIQFPLGEGTSKNPPKWMETNSTGKTDSIFAMPKGKFFESSSHMVSYKFDLEKYAFNKGINISFSAVGSYSAASTKAFNMESNSPPWINVTSSKEVKYQPPNIKLSDINLEVPALPGKASSSENLCHSPSKTQSLETDELLVHFEQPKPKSDCSLDYCPNEDPGDRWVKRLKPSSSNSYAQGPKTENSSHEKINESFSRIPKSSITSSEPTPSKHRVKDVELIEDAKNDKDVLMSHAWIQRWLRNGPRITEKKPEVMVFEPRRSKLAVEKFPKEQQFPSIAAMALMGRALTCSQPCEIQKRGSYTVWNTNAIRKIS
ncbi:hypothetical protein DH2020_029689 [Rehmannia glutinosa]|uniref:Uncharacterized protein n=1 Tax=Rehmannia glutinosa TaxID=99300 RepID=A0ABR0VQG1_REHGL